MHRLRDLDRGGRVVAGLCALALLLAPGLAFAWAAPDWAPGGDTALMALRSLDVGTERTPLTGQPSSSAIYTETGGRHADHPGPLHFFLMAPTIRAFGPAIGMLTVSVVITGGSVLIAAWAVFRQLGPAPGLWAAVILGAVTFTTGATSLIYPVSSSIAGYPLLCSAVLAWCLLCGDIRLLPLATAVVSFAAQQHLSVLPALTVVSVTGLAGLGYHAWRRGWFRPPHRRPLARWAGASGAIALVLWSPVIVDQITDRPGNITRIARFAGDDSRPSLGLGSAVRQVAHVLGWPPLLGRQHLDGYDLLAQPRTLTWLTAALAAVTIALLGIGWRRAHPRRAALAVVATALMVGGLLNGSSVPDGFERGRLVLYHWAFPLALIVALVLGLGLAGLARRVAEHLARRADRRDGARPTAPAPVRATATVLALAAIAVPAALNPTLDRRTNELGAAGSPLPRSTLEALADGIVESVPQRGSHILLLKRGGSPFDGIGSGVALELIRRDMPVRYPRSHEWYVHESRLVDPGAMTGALVIAVDTPVHPLEVPGPVVSEVTVGRILSQDELAALDRLTRQIEGAGQLRFGPAVASGLPDVPAMALRAVESGDTDALDRALRSPAGDADTPAIDSGQAATFFRLIALRTDPRRALLDPHLLAFLADHPLAHPELDVAALDTLRRAHHEGLGFRVRAHFLTPDEVSDVARPDDL